MKWVEVPPSALMGQGLAPYPPGSTSTLFDWAENPDAGSTHLMPHFGQFIVDVVEIEANAVHQPSKPGDEIVVVLNGRLTLTDDVGGREQVFEAGEKVLISAGWAGVYRVAPGNGHFREVAIVPHDYFEPGIAPPPSGLSPRRIEAPSTPGAHELHRKRYLLEAESLDQDRAWPVAAAGDEIIQVLAGELTLTAGAERAAFGPGAVVILPRGFIGRAEASAGYRALCARWLG